MSTESSLKKFAKKVLTPIYKPTRTLVAPTVAQSVLMRPMVFELWYRARAYRYMLTRGMRSLEGEANEGGLLGTVNTYNRSKMWEWHRTRTEQLMAVMRCVGDIPRRPRILCIGPRNEAELLLLHLYNFKLNDVTGIDIFSYSPLIECMDMHDIKFPDNTFDIVYSAWTLKYSYDVKKACAEIVRVLKDGGIVATGFTHTHYRSNLDTSPITGGLEELLGYFEPHVGWVYWKESRPVDDTESVTTIFRVKK